MPKKVSKKLARPSDEKPNISKTIYAELFPKNLSKSDRRKIEIIEGAIEAYSEVSFESVSFDDVAEPAKTSRKLVQHYFPDKKELFETSMKLVRAQFQILAVEALSKAKSPAEQFDEYVRSTFYWVRTQPKHVKSWMLFFLVCAQQPKFKAVHAELTKMGEERIMAMIKNIEVGAQIDTKNLASIAKNIQRLITGGLIEVSCERASDEVERVQEEVLEACRLLLHRARN